MSDERPLDDEDRAIYEWQIWSPGFGEAGQQKLKNATVLLSRCGGLGSVVALELAAAGVGRLVLAHAGNIKPSDLNRQLLMTYDRLGTSRIASVEARLHDLNPRLEIVAIDKNIDDRLAKEWVPQADVSICAAPLFEERFAMNDACVRHKKPLVNCAMYDWEFSLQTFLPGGKPCLRCLCPKTPPWWKRQFPVFGGVSGTVACLGAMEAIKLIAGVPEPLANKMLIADVREMQFRSINIEANPDCRVCGG